MRNKRIFAPGSEWLFIKIYSGPMTLEKILVDKIFPVVNSMIKNQLADMFFFIRYSDPDYHIRLRFHVNNINNLGEILVILHNLLQEDISNHIISRYVIDTYKRELERYGDTQIDEFERLFFYDSVFVVNCLINQVGNDDQRWLTSCHVIRYYFDCLNFSLDERIEFCKKMSESYNLEIFKDLKEGKIQMGDKNRQKRNILWSSMSDGHANDFVPASLESEYRCQISCFIEKLSPDYVKSKLDSIIHMHINRMFRTRQRIVECVIYNLLFRYYVSVNARK